MNKVLRDQKRLLSNVEVKTVFDVGASVGGTAKVYRKLFPEATIYCFEPHYESFERLLARFPEGSGVEAYPFALSDNSGKKKLYVNKQSATNSLFPTIDGVGQWVNPEDIKNMSTIEVQATTLDDFCKQRDIDEIDILKLDIQGGELNALQGGTHDKCMLNHVRLICMELLFVPIYKGQCFYHEICYMLSYKNYYTLFNMYNHAFAESGRLKWCDAIFVRQSK